MRETFREIKPKQIGKIIQISQVASDGHYSLMCLTEDGKVYEQDTTTVDGRVVRYWKELKMDKQPE